MNVVELRDFKLNGNYKIKIKTIRIIDGIFDNRTYIDSSFLHDPVYYLECIRNRNITKREIDGFMQSGSQTSRRFSRQEYN